MKIIKKYPLNPLFNFMDSRINYPIDYINWLKTQPIYSNGELDNLPESCIILHDSLIEEHLSVLGYGPREYKIIRLGTTDPIVVYHVFDTRLEFEFLVSGGLPGISGITTQVSELIALGSKNLIHIGTCGLLGNSLKEGAIIVAKGARVGDMSNLIINKNIFYSSSEFYKYCKVELKNYQIPFDIGIGYTIPLFYYQPKSLIERLVKMAVSRNIFGYIEMEQSGFFAVCELNKTHSLSFVTGSDRYIFNNEGTLEHIYYDMDVNETKLKLLRLSVKLLNNWEKTVNKKLFNDRTT